MEITLDLLLASRDRRVAMQQKLRETYPNLTLVCLTVIMPGNVKRNLSSLITAHAATTSLINRFDGKITDIKINDLPTGYELYMVTSISRNDAKALACDIEDTHPLGRLFDIDVFDANGIPIKRESVGYAPRKCLLCDNESRYCMRNRSHTPQQLMEKIDSMIEAYVQQL